MLSNSHEVAFDVSRGVTEGNPRKKIPIKNEPRKWRKKNGNLIAFIYNSLNYILYSLSDAIDKSFLEMGECNM